MEVGAPQGPKNNQAIELTNGGGQEKLKKKIFLVFRDGGITSFANQIEASVGGLGHEVVTHTFPEGTKEEDIAKWAEENSSQFSGVEIVADDTFVRAVGYTGAEKLGLNSKTTIDSLVDQATFRTVMGPDLVKSKDETNTDDLEKAEQIFKKMIGEVLKSEINRPLVVVIFSEHMDDHSPFKDFKPEALKKASQRVHERLSELLPNFDNSGFVLTDEDIEQYYKDHNEAPPREKQYIGFKDFEGKITGTEWSKLSEQIEPIVHDDYEKDKALGGVEPAEIIKKWLIDLGLSEGIITISQDTEKMSVDNPIFKQEGAWVVVDRHFDLGVNSNFSDKVRRIGMPLGNLYGYLQQQKMLDV
ncbi:MAG TPA: hypothetical protein VGO21_02480, partial [Candidatus Paceibacterota bacterium]|nr:hypothetical protein [Candidatus Paceibacterota bacterium]